MQVTTVKDGTNVYTVEVFDCVEVKPSDSSCCRGRATIDRLAIKQNLLGRYATGI